MFTIDASVHINALNPAEDGSPDSQAFLERLHRRPGTVYSPTLLLVEVAAAVARALDDSQAGQAMARAVRDLPGQHWIPLDDDLAEQAARLAAERRLRGADAVSAAVARCYGATLVTWDRQQLQRLQEEAPTLTPAEALAQLLEPGEDEEGREV